MRMLIHRGARDGRAIQRIRVRVLSPATSLFFLAAIPIR